MKYLFEQTGLWGRSLQPPQTPYPHELERLRTALLSMRANAAQLVTFIPEDCKGLTVHDVTHLDALWEMADLIAGDEFSLNPVEAFVFGAAVLIHDAGMTAASYAGGMSDLVKTTEWRDTATIIYRRAGMRQISTKLIEDPPQNFLEEILFSVLRTLHARHAETLMFITWQSPNGKEVIHLLDDHDLRNAFGQSIGRIAHSHHWDIERVAINLRTQTGSAGDLPSEWTLNEIKVACLLRCADAAHIDHRRAPSLLYALTRPKGISREHWNFQHKLKKATRSGERLVYTEASDFTLADAASWWLCYDTIKMIDGELSTSYALLQDIGEAPFAVRRVVGAESPRLLARHIGCTGWFPVDAEIRVSDPISLARSLGGRNLYGRGALAPIRELLQNAADAVRARRAFEEREPEWGKIRIIVERSAAEVWIHVDDNGIGMSERVLVGPLLDFGKSFWSSELVREEFPGLEARGINPIGKFGIGFFSIFNLGQYVRVVSRKFDAGVSDTRVLEFLSINTRPIVRPARQGELPRDFSTRVSVRLENQNVLEAKPDVETGYPWYGRRPSRSVGESIKLLVSALDIECEIVDETGTAYTHPAEWTKIDSRTFLDTLIFPQGISHGEYDKSTLILAHEGLVRELSDAAGRIYGRAAISMLGDSTSRYTSVGGFVTVAGDRGLPVPYIGVVSGENYEISRQVADPDVPAEVVKKWVSEQATLIDRVRFSSRELMHACHRVVAAGGDPGDLPFCMIGAKFVSYRTCEEKIKILDSVCMLLENSYDYHFKVIGLSDLSAVHLLQQMMDDIIIIDPAKSKDLRNDLGRRILDGGEVSVSAEELNLGGPYAMLFNLCATLWKRTPNFRVVRRRINIEEFWSGPDISWVLSIIRPET